MRLFIVFATAASLLAADVKIPAELQPAARLALSTSPEFAANALLRLVESGRMQNPAAARELLEQAFTLAASAHFRMPRQLAGTGGPAASDTRAGSLAKAYGLGLDTLSLQSRAVLGMLSVDQLRAREMLQAMGMPELPGQTCADALIDNPGPLYAALGAVARSGFTSRERARQDHVALLAQFAAGVHTPVQIAPMIAAVQSAGLSATQLEAVVIRVGGQMETITGDARSFAATLSEITNAAPSILSASLQKYKESNGKLTACKESDAQNEPYWQSSSAQRLMAAARKLRFGDGAVKALSPAERSGSEWKLQLADLQKELSTWEAAAEKSEVDYYQQKCLVYESLVELIPAGPERDKAIQDFLAFVNGSNLQSQSPAEWFLPVITMLDRVRNEDGEEAKRLLNFYAGSGNPVLALYAALESALYAGHPTWAGSGTDQ